MDYRVVEHPELPPGCCFISRTDVGPFLDTGIDVEDLNPIGRVYLAESTVSDFAQQLGYAPPEAWLRAKARIVELAAALAEAQELLDRLFAANAALEAAGYTPVTLAPIPPAGSMPEVLGWVSDTDDYNVVLERARAAKAAELAEPSPRQELLDELDVYMNLNPIQEVST